VTTGVTDALAGANELDLALASDEGFRAWYDRTLPRVYSYLVSRTGDVTIAEELTQEAFIAALERPSRFDGRSDTVMWLCGIARHKLADHFRRAEREERRAGRFAVAEITTARMDDWQRVEERQAIEEALLRLPAAQRAVLLFVDLDGLSVAEAGRLIGRSHGAAQSLLFRARQAFRAIVDGEARDG
jgi:RNA polymerase sigma-70 factor (ECF subfamily)